MNPAEDQFVEDLGQNMVSWGLPRTTGRVYGLLLLQPEPTALDEIAETLGVAKSGASIAARQLVAMGLARASGERGTRRIRYQALYTLESIFAARAAQLNDLIQQLRQGSRVASAAPARRQLSTMTQDLEAWMATAAEMLRQTPTSTGSRR